MDPVLEAAITKLAAKLQKARAAGVTFENDVLDQWLRKETGGNFGLAEAQAAVREMGKGTLGNFGRAVRHGATYGWDDEAIGAVSGEEAGADADLRYRSYRNEHPALAATGNFIGGLTGPALAAFLAPEALGGLGTAATLGRMAAAGGAGGAAAGAGEAPEGEKLEGAVRGGVTGAILSPAVAVGGKGLVGAGRAARNALRDPESVITEQAGRMMPPGVAQQAARQEMLAPGSFIPAGASEAATRSARGIGRNPAASLAAIDRVRSAIQKIGDAKKDVQSDYAALGSKLAGMKVNTDLRDLLHLVGEDNVGMGNTIGFDVLRKLRTKYRLKKDQTSNPDQGRTFREFEEGLTDWFRKNGAPQIDELDSRYSFLSRTQENYEKLLHAAEESNTTYGNLGLYGRDAGSIGGNLPQSTRGAAMAAFEALRGMMPGAKARAGNIADVLVAPADASRVSALEAARRAAMQPQAPTPYTDVALPAAGGSAIVELLQMLQQPSQMSGQQ